MRKENEKTAQHDAETVTVTAEMLAALGAGDVAYVRTQAVGDRTVFVIYSADGQQIGGYDNRDVAFAACRQNDLEPLSVH